jgi:putative ABC transport system ATP-binding protein
MSASRVGRPVLADVTVECEAGATAVVGPSGAGKSTRLRILNRLAERDRGAIAFAGDPLPDYDVLALSRTVALVPRLALLDGRVIGNAVMVASLPSDQRPWANV